MSTTITQETANLVDTLAHAASQVGSTAASAKINQLIVDILPATGNDESIAEALRQDNAELQAKNAQLTSELISAGISVENLALLRDRMAQITLLTTAIPEAGQIDAVLSQIHELAMPIDAPAEA